MNGESAGNKNGSENSLRRESAWRDGEIYDLGTGIGKTFPLFVVANVVVLWLGAIHLHINPFSAIAPGHAVELVTKGTPSYLEHQDLGTPFKVLWTIVKGSNLNIGAVCGDSYSRNKKRKCW
ncbi:hypothetical protein PIB30_077596 [Stylosanthes scabra]|uniref:Uncharacterized protein n=1 Tax=Stylosanthes scabra TaxID=79078 RepID=A0ABU6VRN0_9FABA|nr:hypothetical protein [Stylosanthes scabra]